MAVQTTSNDLNPIMDAAKKATVSGNKATDSIQSGIAQVPALQTVVKDSIAQLSMADQIIALTKQVAGLESQVANNEVFVAAGGHEAQVAMQTTLTADIAKVTALENTRSDIIDDTPTGIGLFDQIINDFRTIQVDAEIADAKANVESSTNNIQRVTQSQESFAKVTATNEKALSDATIAANQTRIASISAGAAAEKDIANIETNATMQLKVAAMGRAEVNSLIQIQQLEDNNRRMDWQQSERDSQAALEKDQSVLINRARSANGLPPQTEKQNQDGLRNEPDAYRTLLHQGAAPRIMLADTPAGVQNNKRLTNPEGNIPLTKTGELFDSIERSMWNNFVSSYIDPTTGEKVPADGTPKNREEIDVLYNSKVLAATTVMRSNIIQGDQSNLFQAPPMDILTSRPLVTDTNYFKQVIKSQGMIEFNTQALWDAGIAAVTAGNITIEDLAEGIDAIHTAAANYNNTLNDDFYRHSVDRQSTYNTSIKVPPSNFNQLRSKPMPTGILGGITGDVITRSIRVNAVSDQMNYTTNLQIAIRLLSTLPRLDNVSNASTTDPEGKPADRPADTGATK